MLSDEPATIAISFGPAAVAISPTMSGGSSACISRGTLSSCSFQRIFRFPTLSVVSVVSLRCQPRALHVAAIGQPVRLRGAGARRDCAARHVRRRDQHHDDDETPTRRRSFRMINVPSGMPKL